MFTNAQLAQQISNLVAHWSTFSVEYANWLGGSASGGPNTDGRYELTDYAGATRLVSSPARLESDVLTQVTSATAQADAAAASATAAAGSASTATAQAGLAATARTAAETAQTAAETAEDGAVNASVNATASQNAAAASATAAAASAAVAAATADDAPAYWMSQDLGDRISLYGDRLDATNMYGFGVEFGALYNKALTFHRWYLGVNADAGVSDSMELNADGLVVSGYLRGSGGLGDTGVLLDSTVTYPGSGSLNAPMIRWRDGAGTNIAGIRGVIASPTVNALNLGTGFLDSKLSLRSDDAHTLTGSLSATGGLVSTRAASSTGSSIEAIGNPSASVSLQQVGAVTDEGLYDFLASNGQFQMRFLSDDRLSATPFLTATRTAMGVDSIELNGPVRRGTAGGIPYLADAARLGGAITVSASAPVGGTWAAANAYVDDDGNIWLETP